MVTLRQIVDVLGVSPAIVSNVTDGCVGRVSAETRQWTEEALWQDRYEVSLKTSSSTLGGMSVAAALYMGGYRNALTDPFYEELLDAIEQELKAPGCHLIYNVPNEHEGEDLYRLFSPWNVRDGILLGYEPDKYRTLQRRISKSLVFTDSYFGDGEESYDNIGFQDYEGACETTSYLLRLGRRSVAFFCDQKPPIASNGEHFRGLYDTLAGSGIISSDKDYYFLPPDKDLHSEVLRQFARKSRKRYTAAFLTSDFYINENINIFLSQGLHVPDKLSVTGFDDNTYARFSKPMLTTIRQPPTDKGRMTVKLLMQRIHEEEEPPHTVQLPTELIVRESVRSTGSS